MGFGIDNLPNTSKLDAVRFTELKTSVIRECYAQYMAAPSPARAPFVGQRL